MIKFIEAKTPKELMTLLNRFSVLTGFTYKFHFVYDSSRKKHVAYFRVEEENNKQTIKELEGK